MKQHKWMDGWMDGGTFYEKERSRLRPYVSQRTDRVNSMLYTQRQTKTPKELLKDEAKTYNIDFQNIYYLNQ